MIRLKQEDMRLKKKKLGRRRDNSKWCYVKCKLITFLALSECNNKYLINFFNYNPLEFN